MATGAGEVRRIDLPDLDRLQGIEAAADALFPWATEPDWPGAAPGPARLRERGFILVIGDPAVGFVHCLDLGAGHWHLEQLAVDPAHGRQGHGRALVREAAALAARHGGQVMTLMTFADVPWNAPFYATEGFLVLDPGAGPPGLARFRAAEDALGMSRWGRRVAMARSLTTGT